jgi:hypothetical protein
MSSQNCGNWRLSEIHLKFYFVILLWCLFLQSSFFPTAISSDLLNKNGLLDQEIISLRFAWLSSNVANTAITNCQSMTSSDHPRSTPR